MNASKKRTIKTKKPSDKALNNLAIAQLQTEYSKFGSDDNTSIDDNKVNKVPAFKEPKEVKIQPEDAARFFHPKDESVLSKLRFTDVALYSIAEQNQAEYTAKLLLAYYTEDELKKKTITDASACIGGNTFAFMGKVKHINAVEISSLHYDILSHNAGLLINDRLPATLLTVIKNNYLNVAESLAQDIVFADPPWGGVDYRNEVSLTYTVGDKSYSLADLVNSPLQYQCEMMMLRVPLNISRDLVAQLKQSNFPHYEEIEIIAGRVKTKDGWHEQQPMYKIIILSHIEKKYKIPLEYFKKVGYKKIKFVEVK